MEQSGFSQFLTERSQVSAVVLRLHTKLLHCLHLTSSISVHELILAFPPEKNNSKILVTYLWLLRIHPGIQIKFLDLHKSLDACIIYRKRRLKFST